MGRRFIKQLGASYKNGKDKIFTAEHAETAEIREIDRTGILNIWHSLRSLCSLWIILVFSPFGGNLAPAASRQDLKATDERKRKNHVDP
jgi:hypothetical protein